MTRAEYGSVLVLHDIAWRGPQLSIAWGVDGYRFTTSLWYDSVDWDELAAVFGTATAETLAFHIAMFEINKGVSFAPTEVVVAQPWDRLVTDAVVVLWRTVANKVWAQWRYEHRRPDYFAPVYRGVTAPAPAITRPVIERVDQSTTGPATLWFCGGGKDSLLASHVLSQVGAGYDAFAYSHSVYGSAETQMRLLERLVDRTDAGARHRVFVFDDAIDLPVQRLRPVAKVDYVLAAETPASVFAALPIALMHRYTQLVVAHERSANAANLRWVEAGENVNHQWGKSLEAEQLLADYVSSHLLAGTRYFSVLAPVHDAVIFGALRAIADRMVATHSCNTAKPWCMRCAKCAYVWISAAAWLPEAVVRATFGAASPLDAPETQLYYRQMLGLESHTPFECIGQVDEVRLAFAMARARGVTGEAMKHFEDVDGFDAHDVLDRYLTVDHASHRLPPSIAHAVLAYFDAASESARSFATGVLSDSARIRR